MYPSSLYSKSLVYEIPGDTQKMPSKCRGDVRACSFVILQQATNALYREYRLDENCGEFGRQLVSHCKLMPILFFQVIAKIHHRNQKHLVARLDRLHRRLSDHIFVPSKAQGLAGTGIPPEKSLNTFRSEMYSKSQLKL